MLFFLKEKNPSLKLIRLGVIIVCPIIWHHSVWDITRHKTLLTLSPPVFKEAGHKSRSEKKKNTRPCPEANCMCSFWETLAHLQREPRAQGCQKSEWIRLAVFPSVYWGYITSLCPPQAPGGSSSVDSQLTLSSSRPSTKIHPFLYLSELSFSTVSMSLRVYV